MSRVPGAPLEFSTVLEQAQQLIAEAGFDALTMRRLAERCGVTAMSLYRHIRTKEELLAVLADRLLADLDVPPDTGLSWDDDVASVFRALRRMWLAHPEFGQIAATQPIDGKVAHQWLERVLGSLERSGLQGREIVDAYDALASYTAGAIQQHAGRKVSAVDPAERISRIRELPDDDFPHVRKFAELLVERQADEDFEAGLAIVLNGISQLAKHRDDGVRHG